MSANIPSTEWKVGEREEKNKPKRWKKKDFQNAKTFFTDTRTHVKKRESDADNAPSTNSFPYHKCIDSSPYQLLSLSRKNKEEKKKKKES